MLSFSERTRRKRWGSPEEIERRRRIRLSVWAYAYEFMSVSVVSDHVFDREALLVDVHRKTSNPLLDSFFRRHFDSSTGMWIHHHPELDRLHVVYERIVKQDYFKPSARTQAILEIAQRKLAE